MTDKPAPSCPQQVITAKRAAQAAANIVAIANERLLDLADRQATREVLRQALQAEADALQCFIDQHGKEAKL